MISIEAILVIFMSNLKMVLHSENTSKSTIQKNLQRNLQRKFLWWSFVIVKPFIAVHSNFTYDSEAHDLIKLYFDTSHSESG